MSKRDPHNAQCISRRRFLKGLGTLSAAAVLGAGCSKDYSGPSGPSNGEPSGPTSAKVAVGEAKMYDHNVLKNKLTDMFDKIGGLSDIIKSGDKVGMKINLTGGIGSANNWERDTGVSPGESFWTHPQVANVVGELCKDAGAGKLYIVESYYDWKSITEPGFTQVAGRLDAEIFDTNQTDPSSNYVRRSVGSKWMIYQNILQNTLYEEFDCFISLPKAKQHVSAGVTHAMKNLVGTLPQPLYANGSGNRAEIHHHDDKYDGNVNDNLCRVILDINSATKIHLSVIDAIKTTIGGEGPWCNTMENMEFNKLIVSKDPVAADSIATQVIGFDPNADDYTDTFALPGTPCINYLRKAEEIGLGVNDLSKIDVIDV